ncbi:phage protein [Cupriavidus necator N-1]|uniref:Phage protein n=1 Tax=Cupriavidus necator (strain ATCC 43291 / DSM 13513 / CCUG 52238 / LMG 8453 / N-1) TaxID=1042878 RepID=G0ER41_CUPNN|nr:putative phage tail protein [Cupriavidus necator]AEI76559.1 phage protein [Cupriavidus necator N-1]MDX6011318.1 putative phage tail protein [Cupriavidus necator]
MDVTVTHYRQQLLRLLPQGPAWPQDEGDLAVRVLNALALTYLSVHKAAEQLHEESDPRATSALLDDWERNYGLPDLCLTPPVSVADRRARLVRKVVWGGGQSRAFFLGFLSSLGYPIEPGDPSGAAMDLDFVNQSYRTDGYVTITEFRPFRANSKCNAALNQGGWRYAWRVNVPSTATVRAMTAAARCNEPLGSWGDPGLYCLLAQHKPAHTVLYISYGSS